MPFLRLPPASSRVDLLHGVQLQGRGVAPSSEPLSYRASEFQNDRIGPARQQEAKQSGERPARGETIDQSFAQRESYGHTHAGRRRHLAQLIPSSDERVQREGRRRLNVMGGASAYEEADMRMTERVASPQEMNSTFTQDLPESPASSLRRDHMLIEGLVAASHTNERALSI